MIHIKKWTCMLVLIITLVITASNVKAQSYTASDNYIMSSQYHDLFNNYFGKDKSYTYFSYDCFTNRHCYYGIDEDNNYLNVSYDYTGSNYTTKITSGIDEEFSVTGINVYKHKVDSGYSTLYLLCFGFVLLIISMLWR